MLMHHRDHARSRGRESSRKRRVSKPMMVYTEADADASRQVGNGRRTDLNACHFLNSPPVARRRLVLGRARGNVRKRPASVSFRLQRCRSF